ncbi:glycosyltransferase [Chloroflexota bacterium]
MMLKILHLITSLDIGGANMMLYKLLVGADRDQFEPAVIVIMDKGKLGAPIEALGIPVYPIGMPRGRAGLRAVLEINKLIDHIQPDLIQAWTYHSNIAASIARYFSTKVPVIWNIRHTPYDLREHKRLTALLIRYGSWFSKQPACIIYNSHVSLNRHRELGYLPTRERVIPNGFDIDKFKPSPQSRIYLRQLLGLPKHTLLIGMIARYHPMKDQANFIHAASKLHQYHPDVHFVLVGRGVSDDNTELTDLISRLDLTHQIHLIGERSDIAEITPGLDIGTLSSAWGDAFPNVIGEAMACEVPFVATDIGDSQRIIQDTGIVVHPEDPEALSYAWNELIGMGTQGRQSLGKKARQRVKSQFLLSTVVDQYESLYIEEIAKHTDYHKGLSRIR